MARVIIFTTSMQNSITSLAKKTGYILAGILAGMYLILEMPNSALK
jgi:hypothetical protein